MEEPVERSRLPSSPTLSAGHLPLRIVLIGWGCLDLVALAFALLPHAWMGAIHESLGMGTLPDAPVVGYLARSTCLLYALHGVLLVGMSFDVRRYWKLVRLLAVAACAHGLGVLAVALAEGMPAWWGPMEGLGIFLGGLLILWLQRPR